MSTLVPAEISLAIDDLLVCATLVCATKGGDAEALRAFEAREKLEALIASLACQSDSEDVV